MRRSVKNTLNTVLIGALIGAGVAVTQRAAAQEGEECENQACGEVCITVDGVQVCSPTCKTEYGYAWALSEPPDGSNEETECYDACCPGSTASGCTRN